MKYLRKYTLESEWENDQQDREANVPVTSWLVDVDEVRYDHEPDPATRLVLTSTSNSEVFTILNEAGFEHEDPDGYTAAELGEITDADFYSSTRDTSYAVTAYYSIFFNSDIQTFEEFQYFTGITSVKDLAFTNCSNLTSITLPTSITDIHGSDGDNFDVGYRGVASPFYGTNITTIVVPNSVTSIGNKSFFYCTTLTSVSIPNSVTSIGIYAFANSGLTSVNIPNSVTTINIQAFQYSTSLTSVVIGNSIISIGSSGFYGCSQLVNITSHATTAPLIDASVFRDVKTGGTLHVPSGANYSTWMSNSNYYLGKYNWTIAYDA